MIVKKQVPLVVLFAFFAGFSFGNIAAPVQVPASAGDLFMMRIHPNPLRIEKETLSIDLTGNGFESGPCKATYMIENPTTEEVKLPSFFITPGGKNITIAVDGKTIKTESVFIPRSSIPWAGEDGDGDRKSEEYGAASFVLVFGPGEKHRVDVDFRLVAGYDNTAIAGISAPEAAHFLNTLKGRGSVAWYRYDLVSASTFKGGFGSLSIEVRAKLDAVIDSNIGLERTADNAESGYYVLSGEFDGIPEAYLDLKEKHATTYNFIGATIAAGSSFPFDGRGIHFTSKALFDVYFSNHQVSAGVEADPFSGMYHALLLYTMFPAGRAGAYGWFMDVRAGGGLAFDIASGFSPGFTAFAGLRIVPIVYELSYKIFPFGNGPVRHELGLALGFGI